MNVVGVVGVTVRVYRNKKNVSAKIGSYIVPVTCNLYLLSTFERWFNLMDRGGSTFLFAAVYRGNSDRYRFDTVYRNIESSTFRFERVLPSIPHNAPVFSALLNCFFRRIDYSSIKSYTPILIIPISYRNRLSFDIDCRYLSTRILARYPLSESHRNRMPFGIDYRIISNRIIARYRLWNRIEVDYRSISTIGNISNWIVPMSLIGIASNSNCVAISVTTLQIKWRS